MLEEIPNYLVDKRCEKTLQKCILESDMPGTYYTLDEIASKAKVAPIGLDKIVKKLEKNISNQFGFECKLILLLRWLILSRMVNAQLNGNNKRIKEYMKMLEFIANKE